MAGPALDVEVEWAPFLLRPEMPEEGRVKPGGPGPHQVNARLKQVGERAGINFTGMCPRFPNTVKAHCLLTHVLETQGAATQNKVQEILFRHYFTDGLYPDSDNLVKAAEEVGMDGEEVRQVLEARTYEQRVAEEATEATSSGVTGVPFFYFNGKAMVDAGAQPAEVLLDAMRRA